MRSQGPLPMELVWSVSTLNCIMNILNVQCMQTTVNEASSL